jgi:nucleoside-diphosphate-sugar epimerase
METSFLNLTTMKISIIGLGWFGWPLAQSLIGRYNVSGSKSTAQGLEQHRAKGVDVQHLSLNPGWEATASATESLMNVDTLVLNIPPGLRSGGSEDFYAKQMEAMLQQLDSSPVGHLVFVSSTGVFGSHQLEADEDTSPEPDRGAGKVLYDAECLFTEKFKALTTVVRPAGLVGGERHPGRFLAGKSGLGGRLHPVNLVHRDDLISLTAAIIERRPVRTVFHAVASAHPTKEAYYINAAEVLGLEAPAFNVDDDSPGKKISAEISKLEAGVKFRYDDPFLMFRG